VYEKASVIRKGIGSAPRCTGGGMTKRLGFPIQPKARLFFIYEKIFEVKTTLLFVEWESAMVIQYLLLLKSSMD